MTRILAILGTVAPYILALLFGVFTVYFTFNSLFYSPAASDASSISFEVGKGWTLKTIAGKLAEKNFIKHPWAFEIASRLRSSTSGKDKTVHAGEYMLSASMSPMEILDRLIKGDVITHPMTVPEGSTVADIAALMEATSIVSLADAKAALSNRGLALTLGVPTSSQGSLFEGYLFPETYNFSKPESADDMVERMVMQGKKVITDDMRRRAVELNMNIDTIIVLASIIEKETGKAEERPIISSVFHNRLRMGMPLQSDPTVIYGIPDFNGNITKEDLARPGPFNTYLNTGLPPMPICNPGLASIQAALYPEDTDYLYFVANCDGGHKFSRTYKEHRQAVDEYQKKGCKPKA